MTDNNLPDQWEHAAYEWKSKYDAAIAERDAANEYGFQNRLLRATHRCKICDARWIRNDDKSWSLASKTCGKCCDMVAMGDQIEAIGLTARAERAERRIAQATSPEGVERAVLTYYSMDGYETRAAIKAAIESAISESGVAS